MLKLFKKSLAAVLALVMIFGLVCINTSADSSTEHVSISVTPSEMSQEGTASVSITLRNTNTAGKGVSYDSPNNTKEPNSNPTDEPDETPEPTAAPTQQPSEPPHVDTGYSSISISNAYGVSFETAGVVIEAGSSRTFTSDMNVTADMIGTTLSFTVSWSDGGTPRSETVTAMIVRANTPYLRVTRTANPAKATPGTTVRIDYTFVNTGSVRLVNITLVDRKVAGTSNPMLTPFTLDPGQSKTFTYEMVMGNSTIESAPQVTYYAYGSSTAYTATVATLTIGLINSQLTKEVVRGAATPEGVTFTLYLTNNGNQQLKNLVVKDELGNALYGSGFSLAVGESKTLQAFIPNPTTERYVVFKITGTDASGAAFTDNTSSYVVRPYIDTTQLKLKFTAQVLEPLAKDNKMTIQFDLANLGSLPYRNLTLTEEQLGYALHTWDSFESGQTDTIKLDLTLDGERELLFKLDAEDTSGNPYLFEAYITAAYANPDDLVPDQQPKPPTNTVDEVGIVHDETELSKKLDSLITDTGKKMEKMGEIVMWIAIAAGVAMVVLGITEIVIRRNNRSKNKRSKT